MHHISIELMTDPSASFHRPALTLTDRVTEEFEKLCGTFSALATFQGLHFKYAVGKEGAVLIESKRDGRFFYWILISGRFHLIHASQQSKLKRMEPISEKTFVPSSPYTHAPDA